MKEIRYGAIFRKRGTDIFVKLASESDGEGSSFGWEYWQIKSPDRSHEYIGSSPFVMNRKEIEDNPNWKQIK